MEKIRRYDLDWLRVIVFGLLIFYHVGMFFVPWGWHIKNPETYRWLQWPMLFINQWRLPILFVISGMGTAFALSYRSKGEFIVERLKRLGIPLAFGMLMIIPPQVYIERLVNGDFTGSYLAFLSGPAYEGVYPEGNISWHHLWFLPYLLVYSIVLTPLFVYFRNNPQNKFTSWLRLNIQKPWTLFLFIIPLYLCEVLLEPLFPVTHNLFWDWFNFTSSLFLFAYGFVLIQVREEFWIAIDRFKYHTLGIGMFCFTLLAIRWLFIEDSTLVHFTEGLVKVINFWAWILTIFGFAAIWLNKKSTAVGYWNRAVYPFYILHQTVTIVLGYYMLQVDWPFAAKFLLMLVGTFGISGLVYELIIRKVKFLQPLFGVKTAVKIA